ncbi:MAG: hypothetical protein J6Q85_01620 [Clostridia bacterium]|nr:hypothetical protein [Clostridia bacterium]
MGHAIKKDAPRKFEELKEFIKTNFYTDGSWEAAVNTRYEQYKRLLGEFTWEKAEEEVVCNSLGRILGSSRVMNKLYSGHRSLFGRIWQLVKGFFDRIAERIKKIGKYSNKTVEQRIVEEGALLKRRKLENMFVKALRSANESAIAHSDVKGAEKESREQTAAEDNKTPTEAENEALTSINQKNMHVSYSLADEGLQEVFVKISKDEHNKGIEVAEFIYDVNQMLDKSKRAKRKKKIGVVSTRHANIINNLMKRINPDFSAEGYELWIDGTCAEHIEARHGNSEKADKTMASREAKILIPWAAQNAEAGEFIRDSEGNVKKSDRFYNSDGTRGLEIKLEKITPAGVIYVSECVPDSINKRIWITSAYINKKGSKGQLLNMEEKTSPQPTPEAFFDGNATNTIISDTAEKINTFGEKSLENSSDISYSLADSSDREILAEAFYNLAENDEERANVLDDIITRHCAPQTSLR